VIARFWRNRWNEVIPFFKFSPEIRKAVYTTNAIEPVNFTIQKIIKHRQSFPNDEAAVWTMPIRDWGAALYQFAIIYSETESPYDFPFTQKMLQVHYAPTVFNSGQVI
jgi:transposase-like protein